MICRVYALMEHGTRRIRYVGMTTMTLAARLANHLSEAKRGSGRKNQWMTGLLHPPDIVQLGYARTIAGGRLLEKKWISKLGNRLLNYSNNDRFPKKRFLIAARISPGAYDRLVARVRRGEAKSVSAAFRDAITEGLGR